MTPTPDKPIEQLSGYELRIAVALDVMGWEYDENSNSFLPWTDSTGEERDLPHWESDRTAAGMVLERIEEMGQFNKFCAVLWNASEYGKGWASLTAQSVGVGLKATPEELMQAALAVARERSGTP